MHQNLQNTFGVRRFVIDALRAVWLRAKLTKDARSNGSPLCAPHGPYIFSKMQIICRGRYSSVQSRGRSLSSAMHRECFLCIIGEKYETLGALCRCGWAPRGRYKCRRTLGTLMLSVSKEWVRVAFPSRGRNATSHLLARGTGMGTACTFTLAGGEWRGAAGYAPMWWGCIARGVGDDSPARSGPLRDHVLVVRALRHHAPRWHNG